MKMEHATNKTRTRNNNKKIYMKYWEKTQHPSKPGQLIRKRHKIL